MQGEIRLLHSTRDHPNLQCAWQLFTKRAALHINDWLGDLPPSLSAGYAEARDNALGEIVVKSMGGADLHDDVVNVNRRIAELPARLSLTRSASCWVAWADAMVMIRQRNPAIAQ